jgi:hypothetical protein
VFAFVAGAYCWKTKSVRLPTVFAFLSFLIFNILMATATPNTPMARIWAYPVFLGIGLGLALTTLMLPAQFSTPPELIAVMSGLMISVRSLGGTIGLALYNAIFNGVLAQNLEPRIAAATLPLGLPKTSLAHSLEPSLPTTRLRWTVYSARVQKSLVQVLWLSRKPLRSDFAMFGLLQVHSPF